MLTTAKYAAEIPIASTTTTVRNRTRALNKPAKIKPNFRMNCHAEGPFFLAGGAFSQCTRVDASRC